MKWDIEEEVLLIDLYFKIKQGCIEDIESAIDDLSNKLNDRAKKLQIKASINFRNTFGIKMKLQNLRYIDTKGEKGLSSNSKIDRFVMSIHSKHINSFNERLNNETKKYKGNIYELSEIDTKFDSNSSKENQSDGEFQDKITKKIKDDIIINEKEVKKDPESYYETYNISSERCPRVRLENYNLSLRIRNCFQREGIKNLNDLLKYNDERLLSIRFFNEEAIKEVKEKIINRDILAGIFQESIHVKMNAVSSNNNEKHSIDENKGIKIEDSNKDIVNDEKEVKQYLENYFEIYSINPERCPEIKLESYDLSVRMVDLLYRAGIHNIKEILFLNDTKLKSVVNLDESLIDELKKKIINYRVLSAFICSSNKLNALNTNIVINETRNDDLNNHDADKIQHCKRLNSVITEADRQNWSMKFSGLPELNETSSTSINRDKEYSTYYESAIEYINENREKNVIDEDVLFVLPADNEQIKIIKNIEKNSTVVVNNSFRIDIIINLVSHLLSQGKSVLITSNTESKLANLNEKMHQIMRASDVNFQDLCISLSSLELNEIREIERVINDIYGKEKDFSFNVIETKIQIDNLVKERSRCIKEYKEINGILSAFCRVENEGIVYDNQTITLEEVNKFISEGIDKWDYISGFTKDDTEELPLKKDELKFLYKSNIELNIIDEKVLSDNIPDIEKVWGPEKFKNVVVGINNCKKQLNKHEFKFEFSANGTRETINNIHEKAIQLQIELNEMTDLQQVLLNKSVDNTYLETWKEIWECFDRLFSHYDDIERTKSNYKMNIPKELINPETVEHLNDIINTGKENPISIFTTITKPKWKEIQNAITQKGFSIKKRNQFIAAWEIINYELKKYSIFMKYSKLLKDCEIYNNLNVEMKIREKKQYIQDAISWINRKWKPFIEEIKSVTINENEFDEYYKMNRGEPYTLILKSLGSAIIFDAENELISLELNEYYKKIESFNNYLQRFSHQNDMLDMLLKSVDGKDYIEYRLCYKKLIGVLGKKSVFQKRIELLDKLGQKAPKWKEEIEKRIGIHGEGVLPNNIESAWKWRQLCNQKERIEEFDYNEIHKSLNIIISKCMDNSKELAYKKTWINKINKSKSEQVQIIKNFSNTVRQIDRNEGTVAPKHIKKVKEFIPMCQSIIPVWIMVFNNAEEYFDPINDSFDVVIYINEDKTTELKALESGLSNKVIIFEETQIDSYDNEVGDLVKQQDFSSENIRKISDDSKVLKIDKTQEALKLGSFGNNKINTIDGNEVSTESTLYDLDKEYEIKGIKENQFVTRNKTSVELLDNNSCDNKNLNSYFNKFSLDVESCPTIEVGDFVLSVRTLNCLEREGIKYLKQLLNYNDEKLYKIKNFGARSLKEIKDKIINKKILFELNNISSENRSNVLYFKEFSLNICSCPVIELSNFTLSFRTSNCFEKEGIKYLEQLLNYNDEQLMKIKNFGTGSLKEIKKRIINKDVLYDLLGKTESKVELYCPKIIFENREKVIFGDLGFLKDKSFSDNEAVAINRYKEAVEMIDDELRLLAYNNPQELIPIMNVFKEYSDNYIITKKIKEEIDSYINEVEDRRC
jgi:DNA-directed RNA polymerase alpha subunit